MTIVTIGRRRQRFPTSLAGRWITAWGLSIVLLFIMRGPGVGIAGRLARTALAPTPTPLGGVEAVLLVILLVTLLVAEFMAHAAPLVIPALAAYHVAVRWARGGLS